jgi:hypothetical protein
MKLKMRWHCRHFDGTGPPWGVGRPSQPPRAGKATRANALTEATKGERVDRLAAAIGERSAADPLRNSVVKRRIS